MPFSFSRLAWQHSTVSFRAPISRVAAIFLTLISLMAWDESKAAMPARLGGASGDKLLSDANQSKAELPQRDAAQIAATQISGSPWPGVIDHLLQRPLPEEKGMGKADIHINYPSIGHKEIDADIREWVNGIADAFQEHLDLANVSSGESVSDFNEAVDSLERDELMSDEKANSPLFELWGAYRVSRPSPAAVSITFELWNYTGSAQGALDIITLNYSLLTGQRLNFVDLFENTDQALELMSSWSRRQLERRLGAARRTQMLNDGTEPSVENFSNITLTPEGVCINFQPYQVAPWDAGIQKVAMPLEELMPSEPLLALWGKK